MDDARKLIAGMRDWANGEGCFNDDPSGEPLLCVYYSQQSFLKLCDQLEAALALPGAGSGEVVGCRTPIAWAVETEHYGRGYSFSNEFIETFPNVPVSFGNLYLASSAQDDGEYVRVPRWLLEQVYGMAREGCEAPSAAYRWCERIDLLFHDSVGELEYADYASELPSTFAAALATPSPVDGGVEERAREAVPVKWWPFVESPGDFAERLLIAAQEFPLLGAVRNVLIENPPTLAPDYIAAALRTQPKTGGDVGRDMLRECYEWFFESKADGPRVSEGAIERGYYTPEFRDLYARLRAVIDATPQQEARAVDDGMARDAARYRWLRDNATIEWENEHGVGWHWKPNKPLYVPLDERVDAALTEPAP